MEPLSLLASISSSRDCSRKGHVRMSLPHALFKRCTWMHLYMSKVSGTRTCGLCAHAKQPDALHFS